MRMATYGVIGLAVMALAGSSFADKVTHRHSWFGHSTRGSGDQTTQTREVGAFTKIESEGAFDITVHFGSPQKVTLTFDDNLIDVIKTKVHGNTLRLSSEDSWSADENCKVDITVPSLESIDVSGSGEIEIIDMKQDEFSFEQSGSGTFKATGTCGDLSIELSGSGTISAADLVAQTVSVEISGSGDAEVHAKQSLDAEVSGSGSIEYFGSPEHVNTNVSGSGRIRKR